MIKVTVNCPNDDCIEMPDYKCENEEAWEGSGHEITCTCGTRITFNIEYFPAATDEEIL